MTKFVLGDKVHVVSRDLAKIFDASGFVVDVFEQEPSSSNFYTVDIGGENYTVFENEMVLVP